MSRVLSQSRVFIAIVFFSCFAFDASHSAQAATTHTVKLSQGESIQAAVSAAPAGTTFVLAAGTYRMQSVKPKADDVFEGQGNVILKGSQVLTFERESGTSILWVAGATVGAPASGQCQAGYPLCGYDQDLFIDGSLQAPASSLEGLKAGSWYFNRSTGKVYIPGNPAGHVVELGARLAPKCLGHRQPQRRGTGLYFPTLYARARVALLVDCLSSCRSAQLWCGAWSVCHTRRRRGPRNLPTLLRFEHTGALRGAAWP